MTQRAKGTNVIHVVFGAGGRRLGRAKACTEHSRLAGELYTRASELDEDEATVDQAERLYLRAIALDPKLAVAYTNLGNVRWRRGDAKGAAALYHRALEIDPCQPEAQYNLGYLALDAGEASRAIPLFRGALESNPNFADAQVNLALAYAQNGQADKAVRHWRAYLQLQPDGAWAELARRHLGGGAL